MKIRCFAVPVVLAGAAVCAAPEACLGQSLPQAAASGPLEQAAYESRLPFHEADVSARLNDGSPVVLAPPASGSAMRQLAAAGKGESGILEATAKLNHDLDNYQHKKNEPFVRDKNDGFWACAGKSLLALVAWPFFLGPVIGAAIGYKIGGPFIGVPLAVVGAAAGVVVGCLMALIGFFGSGIPK